jgi:hypothetical protein
MHGIARSPAFGVCEGTRRNGPAFIYVNSRILIPCSCTHRQEHYSEDNPTSSHSSLGVNRYRFSMAMLCARNPSSVWAAPIFSDQVIRNPK